MTDHLTPLGMILIPAMVAVACLHWVTIVACALAVGIACVWGR
jgi:hypothetical protein